MNGAAGRRAFSLNTAAFFAVMIVFFGVFLLYPVFYVTRHAFVSEGGFTLSFVRSIFEDSHLFGNILRSLGVGVAVTIGTLVLSLPLSYAAARLAFRGKFLLNALLLLPLVVPPFVGALGMRQFLARFGSVNLLLLKLGIISQPIDWFGSFGFWAVVFLETVHLYPIMFLNLTSALANVDPAMEEAARAQGAGPWKVFSSITFPLILPGFFAGGIIVFIWAFTDLGTPLMVGYRDVITVQIFEKVGEIGKNPQGYALVLVVLVVTFLSFILSKELFQGDREFAMISKGGVGSSERRIGRLGHVLVYAFFGLVVFVSVLPHIGIILNSFRDKWFMTVLPQSYTADHYKTVLTHPLTLSSIRNSVRYSLLSCVLDLFLGLWIAYMLVRRKVFGAKVLDAIAMLPLALPGIVLAFGYVGCFLGWDGPLNSVLSFILAPFYGGKGAVPKVVMFDPKSDPTLLLVVAYAVRRLPYIVRSAYAGFQQVSEVFEEASASLGAAPLTTMRKITIPLIGANLLAGAILTFIFAMLEVSDSLILAFGEESYPITKAIYVLAMRLGDGPYVASAMGVWAMLLLACSLLIASFIMGKKFGELFRTS